MSERNVSTKEDEYTCLLRREHDCSYRSVYSGLCKMPHRIDFARLVCKYRQEAKGLTHGVEFVGDELDESKYAGE